MSEKCEEMHKSNVDIYFHAHEQIPLSSVLGGVRMFRNKQDKFLCCRCCMKLMLVILIKLTITKITDTPSTPEHGKEELSSPQGCQRIFVKGSEVELNL